MTFHPAIDAKTQRLTAVVRDLVAEEFAIEQRREAARAKALRVDAAIMSACKAVGTASDELLQAQFAGVSEVPARRKLERAARHLATVMRRNGLGA